MEQNGIAMYYHSWKLCLHADILHQSSFHFAIWVSMIAMVPMLFLPSFKKLSCFNLLGCISTLLVSCTILGVMLSDISRTKMPIQVILLNSRKAQAELKTPTWDQKRLNLRRCLLDKCHYSAFRVRRTLGEILCGLSAENNDRQIWFWSRFNQALLFMHLETWYIVSELHYIKFHI